MKPQSHYKQIDYQERETIALGVETGLSIRAIARMLSRPPSTISREVKRNAPGDPYSCRMAQLRISAIVDACFKLIVDGVSAPSWTRRDARKRGINVSQTSQCKREPGGREAMALGL